MNRNDVTEKIIATKVSRGLTWDEVMAQTGEDATVGGIVATADSVMPM